MSGTVVIGNPRAGRGRADLDAIVAQLARAGREATALLTERAGHAVELAHEARRQGADMVIAVGGDGTVHEVVNGLMANGPATGTPILGVIPVGSGCDYARTFDMPTDVSAAVDQLASERPPRTVDVGEVTFAEGKRYFANIAEVGIGAACVERAARLPRALGPAMYGVAFVMTLPSFKRHHARITLDDRFYDGPLTNLVCAIGRVFGGGMQVAPKAEVDDGLFDVQVQFGTKLDYVRALPKVYKGTHVPHPKIREERAAVVEVRCEPEGVIEADGELLGHTPAMFRVLPGALKLKA